MRRMGRIAQAYVVYGGKYNFWQRRVNELPKQVIELKDEELFIKSYKVRQAAKGRHSVETTIPVEAFEREARKHKMSFEEALEKLEAVWRFDNFHGLHLSFEPCDIEETNERKTSMKCGEGT
jgi:hypothetical protein